MRYMQIASTVERQVLSLKLDASELSPTGLSSPASSGRSSAELFLSLPMRASGLPGVSCDRASLSAVQQSTFRHQNAI
jgi:hypothetical protein